MANTIIQLRRSTTSGIPSSLNPGELGYSYLSNTLWLGTSNGDGVIPVAGQTYIEKTNISYSIAVNAFDKANVAIANVNYVNTAMQAAFAQANNGGAGAVVASLAFDKANNALANTTGTFEGSLTVKNNFIVNSNTLYVDATNNRVGIGTTTPTANLHVIGNANITSNLVVQGVDVLSTITDANNYSSNTYVKLVSPNQIITGDLTIVGNLTLSGNTTLINVDSLKVSEPLIYLAGNNYSSDIVDIGFIANYVNSTGQNVHTGLYREHTDKMYYLFQGYDKDPNNNHIGALSNNMTLAVLNADLRTSNLELGGANAITWITASYDKANSANVLAYETNTYANASFVKLSSPSQTITGNLTINGWGSFTVSDSSGYTLTAGSTYITGALDMNGGNFRQSFSGNDLYLSHSGNRTISLMTNGQRRLHVASSGNVGIGTTAPSSVIHIKGNSVNFSDDLFRIETGRSTVIGQLNEAGAAGVLTLGYNGLTDTRAVLNGGESYATSYLDLYQGTTRKVRVAGNQDTFFTGGNVGIGTDAPTSNLHVIGTANITGSIYMTPGDGNRIWSGSDNLRLGNYPQLLVSDTLGIYGGQQSIIFGGTGAYATIGSNVPWDFMKDTTPQGIRIYGTYTDYSNYERLLISANSTAAYIQTQRAGTGSARPLYLGANNSINMTIDTAGNIGIGITAPTSNLHVIGTANITGDVVFGGNVTLGNENTDTIIINGSTISLGNNQNIDSGTLFIDATNNRVGIGTTSLTTSVKANLEIRSTGASWYHNSTSHGGLYSEFTTSGGPSFIIRTDNGGPQLRLQTSGNSIVMLPASGNVGIGTTAPTSNLHVIGTANITSNLVVQGADIFSVIAGANTVSIAAFDRANIAIANVNFVNTAMQAAFAQANVGGSGAIASAAFDKANNALANTTGTFEGELTVKNNFIVNSGTLYVDATNNRVGIGTTAPTSNLHVIGTANITSNLVVDGIATFRTNTRIINTNTSIQLTDYMIFASGNITLTLPSALNNVGRQYMIKNSGFGGINIQPILSQTIDGESNMILGERNSVIGLISDDTSWSIF